MPTILLMDDTVNQYGHMMSGPQAGFEKHGIRCIFDSGKGPNGALLPSAAELGALLVRRVIEHEVDGVVLDVSWGQAFDWDGFTIWEEAKVNNLAIDKRLIAFMTAHRSRALCEDLARQHGLDVEQVQFKNAQGVDCVVKWFCKQLGIVSTT